MFLKNKSFSPYMTILLSFMVVTILGGILLSLPISMRYGKSVKLIDGFFIATSAICVTGLSSIDIGSVYNIFGQMVILVLIQLGGLGVITFTSVIIIMISKKIGYYTKKIVQEDINIDTTFKIEEYVKKVILSVIVIEFIGTVILFFEFIKKFGFLKAVYYSFFHSVSAFCNAGFSLFSDNLYGFKNSFIINMTIPLLIFLGGIGFSTILNCYNVLRKKEKRLTSTTKLSIKISIFLVIIGMVAIFFLEYSNKSTIGNLSFGQKLEASFFQSVTTRTAGFNTISILGLKRSTSLLFVILMFIGASPGSTGGGIKTTTIGLIILGTLATLKNKDTIEYDKRSVSWRIYSKAITVLFISLIYTTICVFLLILFERNKNLLDLVFEVFSAFGTVGLSRNLTPSLADISKFILIVTMFVGRVGPLTIALALSKSNLKKGRYTYPQENILIG
ncbi:TrkH family potassium uptake protein [Leptotrichia sp. oral taxon 847]|uniref:TrkH family potassium uptake protein n=1 Tax=Leptotrichia sp. oral taxon 847 TaxID=1785996 RepID=UPI000767E88A|nr:TrkH family potassium uptake protein [Leptotrichia sp. oral taxon 847]AMD94703.1 potassium transporter KtrB [Leptotrichia sp. oral taxon 847]